MKAGELFQGISAIKNDSINGSSTIALNSLSIIESALNEFPDDNDLQLNCLDLLEDAKPAMAALNNVVSFSRSGILNSDSSSLALKSIREIRRKMHDARETTLQKAYDQLFKDRDQVRIITCSYSSTICNVLKIARDAGVMIYAYAIESSWNGISYGRKLCDECRNLGIKCQILPDDAFRDEPFNCDFALLGADSIFKDGSVVNGRPSLKLAESVYGKIPLYVIAESFKYSEKAVIETGFEMVPSEYITEIISDDLFSEQFE